MTAANQPAWQLVRPYARYLYYLMRPVRRPDYFEAPWRFPSRGLDSEAAGDLESLGSNPEDTAFLFLPMVDWHIRMQRPQQLALALAKLGHTCIYVNPQLGCEYRLPYLFDPHPKVARISDRILELHVHLPHEHESHSRRLRERETARIVAAVGKLLEQCGITNAVQVVSFPRWLEVAETIRADRGFPLLYDCHDRVEGFSRISRDIVRQESALLASADHISFSAESLKRAVLEQCPEYGAKASVIGNGATPEDFGFSPGPRPAGPQRVIGYAGALEEWFDLDAVLCAARALPECRFQMLGRVEHAKLNLLKQLRNVELVGEVPYESLPRYMHRWSAAMVPFLINRVTNTVDPIKLYEYFSVGLPVVATPLPEIVRRYRDVTYVAKDASEFPLRLREALAEPDGPMRRWRKEIAAKETWISRARSILEVSGTLSDARSLTVAAL